LINSIVEVGSNSSSGFFFHLLVAEYSNTAVKDTNSTNVSEYRAVKYFTEINFGKLYKKITVRSNTVRV